jgi:ABC-type arginine transport system ATPase subunit
MVLAGDDPFSVRVQRPEGSLSRDAVVRPVFQNFGLFPQMTVLQKLTEAPLRALQRVQDRGNSAGAPRGPMMQTTSLRWIFPHPLRPPGTAERQ